MKSKQAKPDKTQSLKVKPSEVGANGYVATKPVIDGFKGSPAKISKANEYICEDEDQESYYKSKGYKTIRK